MSVKARPLTPAVEAVDHLLLGISDLDRGIEWVRQGTGVTAAAGGVHPGAGTRNALLSLGGRHYLEIIAPDPAQSTYGFQIDVRSLAAPRLITFAAVTPDIDAVAESARRAGHRIFGPRDGSRRLVSGETLRWKTLGVLNQFGSHGVEPVPFFIQWARDAVHPSQSSPSGCRLEAIEFEHAQAPELKATLAALGIDARVTQSREARIIARIQTPKGAVELS